MSAAPISEPHHVGALIRAKRKSMGISQTELADALGLTLIIRRADNGSA